MRTNVIKSLFLLALLGTIACNPIYKCGEVPPSKKIIAGKRVKLLISERNTLCNDLSESKQKNDSLLNALNSSANDLKHLQDSIDLVRKTYDSILNESLSKEDMITRNLKLKSDELKSKEKLLADNERKLKELYNRVNKLDSVSKALGNIVKDALLGFNTDELSVEIKNNKIYVSMTDKLLFKSGSSKVEKKGKEALKKLAEVLIKNSDIGVLIEGHTDNVPIKNASYSDNWDLSVARATSIVRILCEDYIVPPSRLTAAGRGEFFPKASNDTPEGKAKNRRTEIILSPKLDELFKIIQ